MKNLKLPAALSLLTLSAAANAGVTSTWTLASDYDFRGITQSAHDPALQASVDYAHGSGWYLGGWASNIDFCAANNSSCLDADYEVDLYTGFSGSTGDDGLGWDLGLIYYSYEESDYNYPEIYASLSKDWFKGKVSYSNDFGGDTTAGDTPAFYVEANATIPLRDDLRLLGHAGYSFGDYWDDLDSAGSGRPYFDFAVGVGYTVGHFDLALKWVDGSNLKESDGTPGDVFSSEGRALLTVATTFPWE